jgi:hypothetical protein
MYDLRSRLVHGSNYPEPGEIHSSSIRANALARIGLLKAVQNSFPHIEYFTSVLLAEGRDSPNFTTNARPSRPS